MNAYELSAVFRRLSFPKNSAGVYHAVRTHAPANPTTITRTAKLHRPAVYRALKALLESKLISKKQIGRRIYYVPENRERIRRLFERELQSVTNLAKEKSPSEVETIGANLRIFNGAAGIRAVFDDVVTHTQRSDTFYRYTSERDLAAVNRYLSPMYRERRDRKHLERLVISNPVSGRQKRPRLERFIKFISQESGVFEQNIIQIVYGNRLAFIDLNQERALVVENAELADFQKVIFRQLYKRLPD